MAIGRGRGKQEGDMEGELSVHVYGQRFVCGKTGHRKSECWRNDEKLARSPSPTKSGKGKSGKKGAGMAKGKVNLPNGSLSSINFEV